MARMAWQALHCPRCRKRCRDEGPKRRAMPSAWRPASFRNTRNQPTANSGDFSGRAPEIRLTPFGFPKGQLPRLPNLPLIPAPSWYSICPKKDAICCGITAVKVASPAPTNLAGFQNGNRPGQWHKGGPIPLRKGYRAALETDSLRSSLFGSLKRDDREHWRNSLVLFAFSASGRREMPRNSMRTGILAADLGRPEGLNRTPECWKALKRTVQGSCHCLRVAGLPGLGRLHPPSHRDCDPQMIPKPCKPKQQNRPYHLPFHTVLALCLFGLVEFVEWVL